MNALDKFTVQNLHAYIDGDLSSKEKNAFEKAMRQDDELKEEVCELRKIKQQVLEHYQKIDIPPMPELNVQTSKGWGSRWAVAASLTLAFGLGFVASHQTGELQAGNVTSSLVADNFAPKKVILHIDSDKPARVQALLQTANQLLEKTSGTASKPQVEIVANDHGIDLFDQTSKNRAEIIEMLKKYDNLKLLACKRALERRADSGHPIKLISNVESDRTAVDEIVDKMQHGWSYHKF
jgi:intracellular sulfur oxidation DsrE/DsrF family protein